MLCILHTTTKDYIPNMVRYVLYIVDLKYYTMNIKSKFNVRSWDHNDISTHRYDKLIRWSSPVVGMILLCHNYILELILVPVKSNNNHDRVHTIPRQHKWII